MPDLALLNQLLHKGRALSLTNTLAVSMTRSVLSNVQKLPTQHKKRAWVGHGALHTFIACMLSSMGVLGSCKHSMRSTGQPAVLTHKAG